MDASTWAILLLLIGMLLLVAEVFIPSGGAISVAAGLTLLGAVVAAFYAWWPKSPGAFWSFLASMAVLLPASLGVAFYFWPSTPIGRRAILEAPAPGEVEAFAELQEKFARMIGRIGETVTLLNPAGIILIDGQRVHCQSEGMILEPRTPVKVIAVQGNRVVVRLCTRDEQAAQEAANVVEKSPSNTPLDFDIS